MLIQLGPIHSSLVLLSTLAKSLYNIAPVESDRLLVTNRNGWFKFRVIFLSSDGGMKCLKITACSDVLKKNALIALNRECRRRLGTAALPAKTAAIVPLRYRSTAATILRFNLWVSSNFTPLIFSSDFPLPLSLRLTYTNSRKLLKNQLNSPDNYLDGYRAPSTKNL
jgi:hypothetical protein